MSTGQCGCAGAFLVGAVAFAPFLMMIGVVVGHAVAAPPTERSTGVKPLAVNAFVRGVLQAAVVIGFGAAYAAAKAKIGDTTGPVDWEGTGTVALNAAAIAVLGFVGRLVQTGQLEPVNWQLDAWIRTGRTLVAGLAVAAALAVLQALQVLFGSDGFDAQKVIPTVLTAAGMAFTAWVHRLAVDPSPIPSAAPPVSAEPVDTAGDTIEGDL
jgi:hypothetical protein